VTGHVRRASQIVRRTRRDIAEDDFLGDPAAEQNVEPVEQLRAHHQIAILGRLLLRVAERGDATRDDRDLVHAIGARPGSATIAWPASWCATISFSKGPKARYRQDGAAYVEQVLVAYGDVEDALTDLHSFGDQVASLREAVAESRNYLRLAQVNTGRGSSITSSSSTPSERCSPTSCRWRKPSTSR